MLTRRAAQQNHLKTENENCCPRPCNSTPSISVRSSGCAAPRCIKAA